MPFETCMTLSSLKWFTLGLVAPEMSIIDAVNPPNNAPNFMKDIYIRNSFERLVSQMYWFAFTFLFNNPNLSQYWIKMIKQKPTTLWYFWLLFPFLLFLLKWSQSTDQRSCLICLEGLLRLIGKLWSISSNQNLSTWLPERIVGMPSLMIITLAQDGISKHSHTNPEAVRAHYSCFMNTVYAKPDKFSANTRETESHLSFPLIKVNGVIFCFFASSGSLNVTVDIISSWPDLRVQAVTCGIPQLSVTASDSGSLDLQGPPLSLRWSLTLSFSHHVCNSAWHVLSDLYCSVGGLEECKEIFHSQVFSSNIFSPKFCGKAMTCCI